MIDMLLTNSRTPLSSASRSWAQGNKARFFPSVRDMAFGSVFGASIHRFARKLSGSRSHPFYIRAWRRVTQASSISVTVVLSRSSIDIDFDRLSRELLAIDGNQGSELVTLYLSTSVSAKHY